MTLCCVLCYSRMCWALQIEFSITIYSHYSVLLYRLVTSYYLPAHPWIMNLYCFMIVICMYTLYHLQSLILSLREGKLIENFTIFNILVIAELAKFYWILCTTLSTCYWWFSKIQVFDKYNWNMWIILGSALADIACILSTLGQKHSGNWTLHDNIHVEPFV